jgi:hypothetical protein
LHSAAKSCSQFWRLVPSEFAAAKISIEKTQWLEEYSQQFDRYYAIPLFAFVSAEEMKEYFADSKLEKPEDRRFRDILSAYVRSIYPVDSVMPIGHKYPDFPFIAILNHYQDYDTIICNTLL